MEDCVFCQIVAGLESADVVAENEDCLAIYPLNMDVNDHLLVLPKNHWATIFEIPADELASVSLFVQEVAQMLREVRGYTGVNLLHASGVDAQQSVGHFHIHVLPRAKDDQVNAWPVFSGESRKTLGLILPQPRLIGGEQIQTID